MIEIIFNVLTVNIQSQNEETTFKCKVKKTKTT